MESNLTLLYLTGIALTIACILVIIKNYNNSRLKKIRLEREFNKSRLDLISELLKNKEEHLNTISHELHDNIVIKLLAIKLLLRNKESDFYANCPQPIIELNDYLKSEVSEIIQEVRNLSHEYQPYIYNFQDLENALHGFIHTINIAEKINFQFQLSGTSPTKDNTNTTYTEIYRIATELIKNILTHSNASTAKLEIHFLENNIEILAEDNGIGFIATDALLGNGLKNIIARVNLFHGAINFHAVNSFKKGSAVFIEIPNESIKLA